MEVDTIGGAKLENAAIQRFLVSITTVQGSAAEVSVVDPEPLPLVFPQGETLVTFAATDNLGNLATDSATITVASTTPPVLKVPELLIIESREPVSASDPSIQGLLTAAKASSILEGELAVTNDAPSEFPFGDTVVTFTATDSSGIRATATTTVTVVQAAPAIEVTPTAVPPPAPTAAPAEVTPTPAAQPTLTAPPSASDDESGGAILVIIVVAVVIVAAVAIVAALVIVMRRRARSGA